MKHLIHFSKWKINEDLDYEEEVDEDELDIEPEIYNTFKEIMIDAMNIKN